MVIFIEGMDKAGKSFFSNMLKTYFSDMNTELKKFPSNNVIGKTIRSDLDKGVSVTDPLVFLSDMFYDFMSLSKQDKENNVLIYDRSYISTYVYNVLLECDIPQVGNTFKEQQLIKFIESDICLKPDYVFYLDVHNDVIESRISKDALNGLNDANDIFDISLIEKKRKSYDFFFNKIWGYDNVIRLNDKLWSSNQTEFNELCGLWFGVKPPN